MSKFKVGDYVKVKDNMAYPITVGGTIGKVINTFNKGQSVQILIKFIPDKFYNLKHFEGGIFELDSNCLLYIEGDSWKINDICRKIRELESRRQVRNCNKST